MSTFFARSVVGCAAMALSAAAGAQSLSGLQIGDNISSTSSLGAPPSETNQMGPFVIKKWTFADGNDLSVTAFRQTGRIVYMESDWGERQAGSLSDFPGFSFGATTLQNLRDHFGNNGFTFKTNAFVTGPSSFAMFNCYQVSSNARNVVAFVTSVPKGRFGELRTGKVSVGNAAKLDALVLADMPYLEIIWGKEKSFDPSYSPIDWK